MKKTDRQQPDVMERQTREVVYWPMHAVAHASKEAAVVPFVTCIAEVCVHVCVHPRAKHDAEGTRRPEGRSKGVQYTVPCQCWHEGNRCHPAAAAVSPWAKRTFVLPSAHGR